MLIANGEDHRVGRDITVGGGNPGERRSAGFREKSRGREVAASGGVAKPERANTRANSDNFMDAFIVHWTPIS